MGIGNDYNLLGIMDKSSKKNSMNNIVIDNRNNILEKEYNLIPVSIFI